MAEKKTNRKPQSLNDSHYRLLQDLSAPPKPSSNPSGSDKDEKKSFRDLDDDHAILQFSGITNFDSSPEEKKPMKEKIEGRRRLCKVSSRNNDNTEGQVGADEPKFSDITDFDSPSPPPKKLSESSGKKDGNEIRDILNDLTSRFDILSIERKRVPKPVPVQLSENSSALIKEKDNEENQHIPEYASAGSSFSLTSDPSDSLSDATNKVGSGVECVEYYDVEDDDLQSVVEDDNFVTSVHETKKQSEELKETESALVDAAQSSGSSFDLRSEFEGDSFVSRVYGTKKQSAGLGNCETRMVSDRLVSNIEEIEDEDDCVVISAKRMVKEASGRGSKFNECDNSIAVDVFDDSVAEEEGSITLTGPKYNYKLPSKIAKMLFLHQRDGLRWLWSLHCQGKGGILGDDMGLGKTMQICGFLAGLFHSCLIKRALVVAPKTLLSHWIKELSIVGLSEKTREYYGTCAKTRQYELQYILQDKGVLLTTYDIVRNNSKSLQGDCKFSDEGAEDSITWDYMILDEGHLIKNPSTQRAKSLLEIPSAHRIIISGTPIQNNLKELWALFNFSCPELLGDKKWFKDRYEYAINRGNEKNASDREKRIGSTVAKELRERIQPYFLRRLKTDVFHDDGATKNVKLSKKNEIIVWLRLTNCQRQLYEAFLKSELVLSAFDGSPLAALTILKKICDHPLLLTKRAAEDVLEGMDSILNPQDVALAEKLAMYVADATDRDDFQEKHDNVSCKISFILCLLDNLIPEGHKVLIFSQTRKMLNLIQESLLSEGYKFLRIDGTTKASDRVKIVDDFQEGLGAPIFLLTSQVGGLGLTLTKADRVIVVDPAWNPSTDNQSVDRAYRIGQTKDVIVYRLMTCGTVEEKIYRKQIFKGGLFKSATEHKEQIRYFSQQDLQELLSLPKQGFDVSVTQQQLHEEHDRQHIMDEYLKAHIKFLETKGIAGVSHHSLLFSKTGPVQVVEEEEEEMRKRGTAFVRNSSSSTSFERNVDGAEYAFNPKEVKLDKKSSAPSSVDKLTEAGIIAAINQLSQTYANKVLVSRLPDKGEKLRKQIAELKSDLYRIRMEEGTKKAIDLDDLSGELQRVLNV